MAIDPKSWAAISKLLDEMLDIPRESREHWLQSLGPEHGACVPVLRDMIAAENRLGAGSFLNTLPGLTTETQSADPSRPPSITGSAIGPYRLLRELGQGGMGTVWLADRPENEIKRPVALKLPILTLHNNSSIAERFARERDILAQLTHPNIARLYDAGVTDQGQPYLALEFVEGEPLTAYCDHRRLDLKSRLRLFLQILRAVQYAHTNLIVHRDLKPANILVTQAGEVRLLDFGIAKLLTAGEANETELTRIGGRALTLDYASPEQILGETITTASDVYSLGVIFFELLTGERPYKLKRGTRAAMEEAILAADPARPSRLATGNTQAAARSTTPTKLSGALKGDLDSIALKALQRLSAARYATADAFAQDIQRYLAGEAVLAQPESAWYRIRKFVLRNKLAVASATAVIASLSLGLGAALWQARLARTEAQTARAVQTFLTDIFRANSIDQVDPAKGRQTTAAELLDLGAKKIDGVLNNAPAAKLQVLDVLGQMYDELELNEPAAIVHRKRVQLAKQLRGNTDPSVAQALVRLAVSLRTSPAVQEREAALNQAAAILDHNRDLTSKTRARLLLEQANGNMDKDISKALQLTEQAVRISLGYPPDRDAVSAVIQQGVFHMLRGETELGEQSFHQALGALDAIQPPTNHDRSQIYTYLGQAQRELQKFDEAGQSQRLAFQVAQKTGGPDHQLTLIAQMDLGWFLFDTGRTVEGLAVMDDAQQRILRTRGDDPQTVPFALNRYGRGLLEFGRLEEGNDVLAQAARMLRKYRPGSGYLATALDLQANALTDLGRYVEARAAIEEAARIHASVHDEPIYVNGNLAARSRLLLATGKADEASTVLNGFFIQDPAPNKISLTWVHASLARADVALALGKPEQALDPASRVRIAVERSPSRVYFKKFEAQAALAEGKALILMRRAPEAMPLLDRAAELSSDLYDPARSPKLADSQIALASCLLGLGRGEQARTLLAGAKAIQATHPELGEQFKKPLRELSQRQR